MGPGPQKDENYNVLIDEIYKASKFTSNGNIEKVDLKLLKSKHVVEVISKNKSLETKNSFLQKYLTEMVNENEKLQGELHDTKETLTQTK